MPYWSSPLNWSAYALAEHLYGVLPHGGGTRLDRPMCCRRHGPSRELEPCSNELDGLSCMHQLFPGREPHQTILRGSRKRCKMKKNKKSLFIQDSPGNSSNPRTSHRIKFKCKWRKTVFRLTFRALEVSLVVLQIIQCLCEMFKK